MLLAKEKESRRKKLSLPSATEVLQKGSLEAEAERGISLRSNGCEISSVQRTRERADVHIINDPPVTHPKPS
jgi:hypothetical protein